MINFGELGNFLFTICISLVLLGGITTLISFLEKKFPRPLERLFKHY